MTAFDRLKKLCDEHGISINVLEERIGLGKNTLYAWKKKVPGGINLEKVADYFEVSTDYLLGRTDDPHSINLEEKGPGSDLIGYFRLNTAGFDPDETEEIEESLKDYTDFLIKKARERKARDKK